MLAKPSTILCDPHPVLRGGLRHMLQGQVDVVGDCADGATLVKESKRKRPKVVICEMMMPALNGTDACTAIIKDNPKTTVILFTQVTNDEACWRALRAGASAYITKDAEIGELIEAIKASENGSVYVSKAMFKRIRSTDIKKSSLNSPVDKLSRRQREILQLIAEGHNTKAMATMCSLSSKTIEYHRAKLMERLDIRTISGLVKFAIQYKLTSTNIGY